MALRVRVPRISSGTTTFNISCNLIASTESIYNATISSEAFINATIITSTTTFYLATVVSGAANISCNLIPSTQTFFPPFVIQDDKTVVAQLLPSTIIFPLLALTGGISEIDASDILDRRVKAVKRKRKQDQLDEENVAAQILKARQKGKEVLQPERRKPLELKIRQQLAEDASANDIIETVSDSDYVFLESEKQAITNVIENYRNMQKALQKQKQLQVLMLLATELEDD